MADVRIRFLGDAKDVTDATKKVRGDVDGIEGSTKKAGRSFTELGGVVKLAMGSAVVGSVVQVGLKLDDLNTQMEATNRRADTVFGELSDEAREWADEQNEAFGVGESKMLGLAAATQDLLVPMGFARDEAFNLTQEVLTTANALSEWTGGTIKATDAQKIVTKAMLGERDGLVELGVKISEAQVQQRLLEKGQQDLTGTAKEQATAQATLELIMGKSADALAAYSDRAGTAIAKNKEMSASTEDAAESWAQILDPFLEEAKDTFVDVTVVADGLSNKLNEMAGNSGEATEEGSGLFRLWQIATPHLKFVGDTLGFVADEMRDSEDATEGVTVAMRENIDEVKKAPPLVDGWQSSLEDVREKGIDPTTAAILNQRDAIVELAAEQRAQVDPLFKLRRETMELREAQQKYTDVLVEHGPQSREAEDAAFDLAAAQSDANQAAAEYARDGGPKSVDALKDLLAKAGLSAEAIRDIIDAISDLNSTPVTSPVFRGGGGGGVGIFHDGGVVPGPVGRERLILAKGGETVLPTHKPGFRVPVTATSGSSGDGPTIIVQGFVGSERQLAAEIDRLLTLRSRSAQLGFN